MGEIDSVNLENEILDGNGHSIAVGITIAENAVAEIRNMTFKKNLVPMGSVLLTNCTFDGAIDASKLANGKTITMVNCNYLGKPVEKAVLTSDGDTVTVTEGDAVTLDANKMILRND